eukprot:5363662-Prorocentrum_lima.AAC.1
MLLALFGIFLVLPEDIQIIVVEQIMPWTVGCFILFVDLNMDDDSAELVAELLVIFLMVGLLLGIV